jgi:hypothetical protein
VSEEPPPAAAEQPVEQVIEPGKKLNGRRADRRSEGRLLVAGRFYNAIDYVIAEQRRRSTHR